LSKQVKLVNDVDCAGINTRIRQHYIPGASTEQRMAVIVPAFGVSWHHFIWSRTRKIFEKQFNWPKAL